MSEQSCFQGVECFINKTTTSEEVRLSPAGYVTVRLASAVTGLSLHAIRGKIREGKWVEGREFVRAPDGGVFISLEGFERWVCAGSK